MEARCILEARSASAECALWSPGERVLYWLDQIRPEIHRLDPVTGEDVKLDLDLPEQLGAVVLLKGGGLALAAADGITLLYPDLKHRRTLANPIAGNPKVTFNDAKCDRQGRLWAGTTDRKELETLGKLYRIDADGSATEFAANFICSNGPSFSPDGRVMYHSCSHEKLVNAYDLDPGTGSASNARPFVRFGAADGAPDGSTVDAEGYFWSAHWGGSRVTRYAPDGTIDRVVEIPVRNVTSCAFGGENMDRLFVTTASVELNDGLWIFMNDAAFAASPMLGGIFVVDVGIKGLPEPAFDART